MKKEIILMGEGIHQHSLYGDFEIKTKLDPANADFVNISVKKDSVLKHEKSNGVHGEHKSLIINQGSWRLGKQVEYNPFSGSIERVWD
jgi:hypothetical protein